MFLFLSHPSRLLGSLEAPRQLPSSLSVSSLVHPAQHVTAFCLTGLNSISSFPTTPLDVIFSRKLALGSWTLDNGQPAAAIYGAPQNEPPKAVEQKDEPLEEAGLVRLRQGQELLIAYNFNPGVPLMSYFLNFGFIPLELAQQ